VASAHIEWDTAVLCVTTEKGIRIAGRWVVGGAAAPGSPPRILDGHRGNDGASNG
jgi:hypothetical protein